MFDVESEKLVIIENIIKANDEYLLREIKSLLCTPSLKEYETMVTVMDIETFYENIQKSEQSIAQGHVKSHSEVRQIMDSWN